MGDLGIAPNKNIGNGESDIDKDLNNPSYLDTINLDKTSYSKGLTKSIIFTLLAIIIFFVPLTLNGNIDVPFGHIYNFFLKLFGNFGLWVATIIILVNAFAGVYGKFFSAKDTAIHKFYKDDSVIHPFIYLLGAVYILVYAIDVSFIGFVGPEWIVGADTGGTVVPFILLAVVWIILVGAFFIPFLLNYGGIDFVGAILEPLMRPVFKVPGKSAIDATTSFVTSSSMAVIITSKLYNSNVYTKREAAIITTGFSAVSVGFAMLVIKTAGLAEHFTLVYFSSLIIAFIISAIMARIPPLNKKEDVYYNGRVQTVEDRTNEAKFELAMFKRGVDRAAKKAYYANSIFEEIKNSLLSGIFIIPKVISFISAVGITGLIAAEYTPIFKYLGAAFIPLLNLFSVPNAVEIAPSLPVGIAEMFLPVLLIADKVDVLNIGARYFITTVSMVQILFFSETIAVILATKLPIKLWELVVIFVLRTVVAIPIVAAFMHILF